MKLKNKPNRYIFYIFQAVVGTFLVAVTAGVLWLLGYGVVELWKFLGAKLLLYIIGISIASVPMFFIGNWFSCWQDDRLDKEKYVCGGGYSKGGCGKIYYGLFAEWWHKRRCLPYLTQQVGK